MVFSRRALGDGVRSFGGNAGAAGGHTKGGEPDAGGFFARPAADGCPRKAGWSWERPKRSAGWLDTMK